ncbi:MAG: 50S ribosomal protein L29 [Lentisphaerae bacterium RIFOXYC12_FULL_60_16]|nr:MAG: 50S ribosomal protein L29 [Lentisphaerae bacterium RIFOXYC12_FULL_60_16]OGV72561.1 MAG: 50S ribosomal protein L29 [Lentisphaerae bacterium RIFOXYA12_FULL_60_10]OGV77317.1 MAG: 50S ribosomal protein L29 [Lentisphaerae bacterium RIFOXYB12_FULL_60_10]
MKSAQYREQTDAELQQVLRETQGQLAAIRVKRTMGDSSEQPLRIRTLRRDLARIHTVIRERELKGHG